MLKKLSMIIDHTHAMESIRFIRQDGLRFAATDGHRLHLYQPSSSEWVSKSAFWDADTELKGVRYDALRFPSIDRMLEVTLETAETFEVKSLFVYPTHVYQNISYKELPCGRCINEQYLIDALGEDYDFEYRADPVNLRKGIVIVKEPYTFIIMPISG